MTIEQTLLETREQLRNLYAILMRDGRPRYKTHSDGLLWEIDGAITKINGALGRLPIATEKHLSDRLPYTKTSIVDGDIRE